MKMVESSAEPRSYSHSVSNYSFRAMLNILSNREKGLRVCYFNARSLNVSKLDYFRYIFENSSVDIVCVSETWFKVDVEDKFYSLPNYKLFRNDRVTLTAGGGVAIYCKSTLNCKLVTKSDGTSVEYIIIEVSDNNTKCLVSCVYNPDRSSSPVPFFSILSDFSPLFEHILISGDFNADLFKNDSRGNQILDNCSSLGLSIVNSHPTRFSPVSVPSLLDLFIVADASSVLLFDQLSLDGISDHDLLYITYDIRFSHISSPLQFSFSDFSSIDLSLLQTAAGLVPWDHCLVPADPNDKIKIFQSFVCNLFHNYVPLKTVSIRNKSCPWFTTDVINAIRYRNRLYSRWKRTPNSVNWTLYKIARNNATRTTRDSKRSFYNSKLNTVLPSKTLWRNLRDVGISGKGNGTCAIDPDVLNDTFLSNDVQSFNAHLTLGIQNEDLPEFSFNRVTSLDVHQIIMSIKSNAIGEDGIQIRFIKMICPFMINHLTHILNSCLMSSVFPHNWKLAKVVPVAKKPKANSANDFRPISILPCLSKVLEKVLALQIRSHLDQHSLLYPLQSGFREGHSCASAMVNIMDDVRIHFDKGHLTFLCLLDFSKAFDTVNHELLCLKLRRFFNFSPMASSLLFSFLSNRQQRVVVADKCSGFKSVKQGVPQGSILGPILFCMFINDLPSVCKYVSTHLYADDVQLCLSGPLCNISELGSKFNDDLSAIHRWSASNGLVLNPTKSQIIPICRRSLDSNLLPGIYLSSSKLTYVDSVTSLGYKINRSLSCCDHISFVIGRIYGCLRKLWVTASFTPVETRRRLVLTMIVPILSYAEVVYSNLDSLSQHKLQVCFNNSVRYIYGLKRYSRISHLSTNLLGCTMQQYFRVRNCIFLHKIINGKRPDYLYKKLSFSQSRRTLNINMPSYNYLNSSRLFFIHSVRLWNSLPMHIKGLINAQNFKKAVFRYFSMQQ